MSADLDPAELIEVSDSRTTSDGYEYDGYYSPPETYGDLVTQVTGTLREMVLTKVGYSDDEQTRADANVTITEHHWNSGYCETCSSPETDFIIHVDGEEVYRATAWAMRGDSTSFGALQQWLTTEDEEDDYGDN